MRTIRRRKLLYRTGVEYAQWAINHIEGCTHNCRFPCYARLIRRFDEARWGQPKVVENAFELLKKELKQHCHEIGNVHLCFSTDPFMVGFEPASVMSLGIIKEINKAGIPCTTLTKGVYPAEKLKRLDPRNEYGITIITLDDEVRQQWEPGASTIDERLGALEKLHRAGLRTWVSIEPWMPPHLINGDLGKLLKRINFVQRIIFGKGNYNRKITEYAAFRPSTLQNYYDMEAAKVIDFCRSRGISCHIKTGTMTTEPRLRTGAGKLSAASK